MTTLNKFRKIIDWHTIIIIVMALISTYIWRSLGIVVDLPTSLIGTAFIFPLVFSINSAYRRREEALRSFASLRAHAVVLYLAHKDWVSDEQHLRRGRALFKDLLMAVYAHLAVNDLAYEKTIQRTYRIILAFSRSHEILREAGMPANEVSRANQYLRSVLVEFERMNNIARYRTPVALRAYSQLLLNAFPIMFGPFFANIAYPDYPIVGYIVAGFYGLVLVSLDNIQDHLENPFDGEGLDDLRLDIADEYLALVELE